MHTGPFSYNLDHGFILECLIEHYRFTRDRAWLQSIAPRLVAACAFIARERQRTMVEADGERSAAWGLLPAGHLEDNPEWRHWFAVNAHAHGGMRRAAEALAEIGHPEAGRLRAEAEAYRRDILVALRRARQASPVVRLRDGSYVPHLPTRTDIRGRDWGWFREAAYGPLHLVDGLVLDPLAPEITWVLRNLEDNLFVSRDYGRAVDVERDWFSHGGVTIQANLLNNGPAYLRRGQRGHAVRSLFNNVGASLYRDVRSFSEHPVNALGRGIGPFYKTPDESGFLYWLRCYLVREESGRLLLLDGCPLSYYRPGARVLLERMATHFGPVDLASEAAADEQGARVSMTLPPVAGGAYLRLLRADGSAWHRYRVNGADARLDGSGRLALGAGGGAVEVVANARDTPAGRR